MRLTTTVLTATLLATGLSACVVAPYQQAPQPVAVQQVQRVDTGRVAQMELIRTQERPQPTGGGALIGGILGAVIGHQIGGGVGKGAATVLGGVGGAVAGNAIEGSQQPGQVHESYRVSVQGDDGSYRYFSVPPQTDLRVGDRVRMGNGQLFRY
ncbi:MAG: glycine zipper 2TM domain-containing protein [Rhodoferax sp.]|uniref:glycine zipper 2TM domain-containing protein n=1 Tax=Rhodoferax sp. TaxID=50421 RepID=UPI003267A22D